MFARFVQYGELGKQCFKKALSPPKRDRSRWVYLKGYVGISPSIVTSAGNNPSCNIVDLNLGEWESVQEQKMQQFVGYPSTERYSSMGIFTEIFRGLAMIAASRFAAETARRKV